MCAGLSFKVVYMSDAPDRLRILETWVARAGVYEGIAKDAGEEQVAVT